jgi:hypothetical protein
MGKMMIERVAKAILDTPLGHSRAGAAIDAMREPTQEMLDAAREWSAKRYGKPLENDEAIGCWQAMCAAARGD